MENIKVILWGLGAMGSGMGVDLARNRKGVELVGAIGSKPAKFNRDLGEVLELGRNLGVKVSGDPDAALRTKADIVLHSTDSFARNVVPQLEKIVTSGKNVITTAEQMAALRATEPEMADRLDALARRHGVTVLGAGVNPGFVLDTLVVTLSGACQVVDKIRAARVNDLSPFGPTVMRTQGVGCSVEEFEKGVADGSIVGHVGFQESIYLIAESLGWELERIEETREPIIARTPRATPHATVRAGEVAGCNHIARGFVNGREAIVLEHPQQIHPHLGDVKTGDYITIEGVPGLTWSDEKEIPGGISTMAVVVNMIPQVINAEPGLKTMLDLPVVSAVMGDMRAKLRPRHSGPGRRQAP